MIDYKTQIPTPVKNKTYVKFLEDLPENKPSWKFHIDNIAMKISRVVGVVARLRHFDSSLFRLF